VVPLPDAALRNRENGSTDLRLNIGAGSQEIGRVAFAVTGSNVVPVHMCSAQPTAPGVTRQPQDATVSTGSDATFSAQAIGDPTPRVQWQSKAGSGDWADVPGATSTTFTVKAAVAGDDGNQYRAVFVNAAGSNTTDPATLHVH
jgi:hypothetical protein